MTTITQHPDRPLLHNEVHARPPEALAPPLAISHVVMLADEAARAASRSHVSALLAEHHRPPMSDSVNYLRTDLGGFGLRWEMHTEFVTWTFFRTLPTMEASEWLNAQPPTATDVVPAAWLAALPGQNLVSLHLWALEKSSVNAATTVARLLREDSLTGSQVISHSCDLYTDMALHADGFSRMLVLTGARGPGLVTPRRLGRLVQRLLEIETYRMAALLGLPVAREVTRWLATGEAELAALAQSVRTAAREDEAVLLDRLTRLAADLESQYAATHARFAASAAYDELLNRRLADIAERRIEGMQSLRDFMERRLTPAMSTCRSADRRQAALSARIARMSNLLRTRVDVEQQQSARSLLSAMNRRQDVQLKLQSMVEGLSVAAITYSVVGLIGYLVKGAQKMGWPFSPEATMAAAVPLVALSVWWSLRKMHHRIVGEHAS